jgi:hypothetical protein
VVTGARPATRLKQAASALVRGGDRLLLHNLLLDLVSSLTILFALSGSSNGTPLLLQLQLRPWRVIPQGYPVDPTPPGLLAGTRAIPTATPTGSGRNTMRPARTGDNLQTGRDHRTRVAASAQAAARGHRWWNLQLAQFQFNLEQH